MVPAPSPIPTVPDLTGTALRLIELYGPLAVATFTFLESSMLFPFLPSEIVVPAAAVLLIHDVTSFVVFVGSAGLGGTAGAFVLFYAFYSSGSRWVDTLQGYVRLSDESITRSRRWFLKWGVSSVLWGRFLPGLRSVISIPAGLFEMDPLRFGVLTALGTVGFYTAVAAVVYFLRQQSVLEAVRTMAADRPALVALFLVGAVAVSLLVTLWYQRSPEPKS